MSYKVFISSTRRDIDVARDLARRVEEAGVRVFPVEETSVSAESAAASVTRSLREADEVIVIFTGNSVNSPSVLYEMGAASGLHKRVTPIVVNVEESEIPPFVKKNYVRFAELPSYIAELAKRAGGLKPRHSAYGTAREKVGQGADVVSEVAKRQKDQIAAAIEAGKQAYREEKRKVGAVGRAAVEGEES